MQLLVDGKPVERATGCNTELMGRRVWNIARHRGRNARLEIVDHSESGWGRISVDTVVQWQRRE